MMFAIEQEDLKDFDGTKLVKLLRVLMYAEARRAGVPLRNVDVPLQITVADGGKDASVLWDGGADSTEFFPSRDVVFQCKATDRGDSQWKKEVWTKASQPSTATKKVLNRAVKGVLDRGGCYVGVTASPLVGSKAADARRPSRRVSGRPEEIPRSLRPWRYMTGTSSPPGPASILRLRSGSRNRRPGKPIPVLPRSINGGSVPAWLRRSSFTAMNGSSR